MSADAAIDGVAGPGIGESAGHYRYPGAPPFGDTDLDRRLFRGRAVEAETVLHTILSSDLFLLYAQSGLGKTSLLNAGVLHELRARGHWPVSVRLNNTGSSPVEGIRQQIVEAAANDPDVELRIATVASEGDPTLWDLLASIQLWRGNDLLRLVLILDQFEEFFTLGWSHEERQRFITEFGEVARHHRAGGSTDDLPAPDVRFVLVIREDSLGSLEALATEVPRIMRNRFRLGPLDPEQAESAIREPAALADERLDSHRFEYTESAAAEILDFLRISSSAGVDAVTSGVDPSQLQIVCQYVERAIVPAKSSGRDPGDVVQIDAADLGGKAGLDLILSKFYRRTVDTLPAADQSAVRTLCETGLINRNGRRVSLELDAIVTGYDVDSHTLEQLVDQRLLRAEPRLGSTYYELSHDTLVAAIMADREERLARVQRRRRNVIASVAAVGVLLAVVIAVIAAWRASGSESAATTLAPGQSRQVDVAADRPTMLAVQDPDGGVLRVTAQPEAGRRVIVEVGDEEGAATVDVSPEGDESGFVSIVQVAAAEQPSEYSVVVSALDSAGGSVVMSAAEITPDDLADGPAVSTLSEPSDIAVLQVDVGGHAQVVDLVPEPVTAGEDGILDLVVESVGGDTAMIVDDGPAGAPERVVLTEPGSHHLLVRSAAATGGSFTATATEAMPAAPDRPAEVALAGDGQAAYFEIPSDDVRAVVVTSLDEDLDLEMRIVADGNTEPPVDASQVREIGFAGASDGTVLIRIAPTPDSEVQRGEFRFELAAPAARVTAGAAAESFEGLTTFEIANEDAELLEFLVTPGPGRDDGDGDSDEEPFDDGDAIVLDVFDQRGDRVSLNSIRRADGGASLILDRDDVGPYAVVASTPSASDDPFSAQLTDLPNPRSDGEPIEANVSRPFFVTVEDGEQVEFAAFVDTETGPPLDITWTDVDDPSIAGGASTFLAGDSVGLVLGCAPSTGAPRRIRVDVNLLEETERSDDYVVQVRTNPDSTSDDDPDAADWCGPRTSPSLLIGPTLVSLITRSGGSPEQAHCVVRRWHGADDGGPSGVDRDFALFGQFAAAATAPETETRDQIVQGIFDEFQPHLSACGVAEAVVGRAAVRVQSLVEGDTEGF